MMSARNIVVTGLGMQSAVGSCADQTCAAVRAGINRFAQWQWFTPNAEDESEEEAGPTGVTASAVEPDLGDKEWTEKSLMLLLTPFFEAVWHAKLTDDQPANSRNVKVYVATPYIDRDLSSSEADDPDDADDLEDSDLGDDLGDNTGDDDDETDVAASRGSVASTPSSVEGVPPSYNMFTKLVNELVSEALNVTKVKFFPNDHAAGGAAMAAAMHDLENGQADVGIVVGLDSLLHTANLEYLIDNGYLKSSANPTGAIPGEAAAVLVLETLKHALDRQVTPLASLGPVSLEMESYQIGDDQAITGRSLSNVLRSAVEAAGGAGQFFNVMVDLNGQRARFIEWATVETRCMHQFPRGWRLNHPADCIGDVGAAYIPLAVGLAARAMFRGYEDSPTVICSSSLRGERAALSVFPWRS
ncbi:MAG: hypothetical protein IT423_00510 [Pirellulaceae bacterium]|nr:hypothetical protein [Pirellulaceae bacterium]